MQLMQADSPSLDISGLDLASPRSSQDASGVIAEHFAPSASAMRHGSPLRVVHLGKFFHPAHGGIERAVRSLAQAQAALGCRVQVICMDHERHRATRVEQDGPVEIIRLRRAASYCKIDHCPDLKQVIRDSGADLLHLHTPNPSMMLGLTLSGDRRPLVVSHHSDVIKQRFRRVLFSPIERMCYSRAKLVLAMSPPYIEGSSVLKRCSGRLGILPIGLDLEPLLNPSPEIVARSIALRQSFAGPIWFSCGRLVYYKGLDTAIRALQFVPGTLLIAGDGPHRKRLERLATRLNLIQRVRFLGRILGDEELIAHYMAADAFWFPSNARSEAFGLVQVEAMAAGCPVINAAIPDSGVSWVSRHEESGLTVALDDPAAFAAAALRFVEEQDLRGRLSAGARARAMSEFGQEAMGRRSIEFYRNALAYTRRAGRAIESIDS